MLLPTLRLFLPQLRLTAFVPDGHSASLAASVGVPTLLRPPSGKESDFRALLNAIAWTCDLAVVDGRSSIDDLASSITWTFDHLSTRGEMVVVLPVSEEAKHFGNLLVRSFRREVQHALAAHVWLRVVAGDTVAIFLAKTHLGEEPQRLDLALLDEDMLKEKARRRPLWREGAAIFDSCDLDRQSGPGFQDTKDEFQRQHGQKCVLHRHNFWLEQGALKVGFDGYQRRLQPPLPLEQFKKMHGFTVGALDPTAKNLLRQALRHPRLRLADEVRAALEASSAADARQRAPFYSLAPEQRLGWLADHPSIHCVKDCGPFRAGQDYKLRCVTGVFSRPHERPSLLGEQEVVTLHARDTIFEILHLEATAYGTMPTWHRFADWTGRHLSGCERTKGEMALRHSLLDLIAAFDIPEVPDVATLCTEQYRRNLEVLDAIQRDALDDFTWRRFQREDLARFALHDGGIFAWDKGGGKGLATYAIPVLYGAKRTLLTAPEGLHDQICADWKKKFGLEPRRIMSVGEALADKDIAGALRGEDTRGFWLTSYTALGYNGADEWPDEADDISGAKLVNKKLLASRTRAGLAPKHWEGIGLERTYDLPGGAKHTVRCVHTPSMATVLQDVFDCVECDEAVRLKATDSYVSLGVRRMRARHRVALTGTPVKNRMEDLFWLAHWCAGSPKEGNARFPFPDNNSARNRFADLYMVTEENHTRAEKFRAANPGRTKTFKRRLPQTTNFHELWKLLGSLILRRRKQDFGEDMVPKTIVPVKVKPGRAQQEVYRFHLTNPPKFNAEGAPILDPVARLLAQLGNLRMAACCPDAPNLRGGPATRSWTDLSPLLAGTFGLIEEQLSKGEQVMVASPFQHFSRTLEERLKEAGVSCIRLDGETSARERGRLAAQFKQFAFAVLIAGQQAMGEGNSFEQCPNLILPALHWAYDVNSQVEDRVHRLTSTKPVTIYVLSVENTISERLLALYREKSAASAAAIDGRQFGDDPDEEDISLGQLLREAQEGFHSDAPTIDERTLEDGWPAMRDRLRVAELRYREFHPPIVADRSGRKVTSAEVKQAVAAIGKLPPDTSEVERKIAALPAATLALLGGTDIERTRTSFGAFASKGGYTDWRQAWDHFAKLSTSARDTYSTDPTDQQIHTTINRLL